MPRPARCRAGSQIPPAAPLPGRQPPPALPAPPPPCCQGEPAASASFLLLLLLLLPVTQQRHRLPPRRPPPLTKWRRAGRAEGRESRGSGGRPAGGSGVGPPRGCLRCRGHTPSYSQDTSLRVTEAQNTLNKCLARLFTHLKQVQGHDGAVHIWQSRK